jgi:hypothetical protein
MQDFLLFLCVGFLAQIVDGALGMAYGITSTSFLLATGSSPAVASASVHIAEVFTTGVSGVAHIKLGNVSRQLFLRLLLPGIVGATAGAWLVSSVDAAVIKPVVAAYLLLMGLYVLSSQAGVTVAHGALAQAVDVTVDAEGRPVTAVFQRWSNANPDKVHRLQPFGAHMSDFREVQGYRLPFRIEAGNMFGTDDYFPFFLANVTEIRFPQAPG